jgi:hypothetical protein
MADKKSISSHKTNYDDKGGHNMEKAKNCTSRRQFVKKALVSSVALTSTGVLANKVASLVPDNSSQKAYLNDVLPGDRVMMNREYVMMTDEEKKKMIGMLIKNYKKKASQ